MNDKEIPNYVNVTIDKDKMYLRLFRGVRKIVETHGLSDTTSQTLYGVSEFLENIENRDDGFFSIELNDIFEMENLLEEIDNYGDDVNRIEIPSDFKSEGNPYFDHAYKIAMNAYDYYISEIREDLSRGNLSATCFDIQSLAEHLELATLVFDMKMGEARDMVNCRMEENPDGFSFEQVEEDEISFIQRSGMSNVSGIHDIMPSRVNSANRPDPTKPKRGNHLRSVK